MRFYPGAHSYLHKASQRRDTLDQCLYLVAEVDNKYDVNAVMLHNGKMKLGSVNATDTAKIKRLLNEWHQQNAKAGEDVIVCRCDAIYIDPQTFGFKGSVQVHGMHRVNERLARKFSDKYRKD